MSNSVSTLANLSLQTGKFPARSSQRRCCRCTRKRGSAGHCQSIIGRYLAYLQSPWCWRDLCWHVCVPTSPTPRTSASGSRPTGRTFKQWYMQNQTIRMRSSWAQSPEVFSLTSVSVADIDLLCRTLRVLSVTLDRRLNFDNARSCNYHARAILAIHHIHHLLTLDITDFCMQPGSFENRLLQLCAARRSIRYHPEAQNNAALIVQQAHRSSDVNSLLQTLYCRTAHHLGHTSWPC